MKFCKQTLQRSLSVFLNLGIGASSLGASRLVRRSFSLLAFHRSSANMSGLGKIPYASQDVQEVQKLISNLSSGTKNSFKPGKKHFSCKKSDFKVVGSPENLVVTSWRFQDWDYKRDDLPTYARGLFTAKNEKGQPEVAIRGYDKFFNVDEVNATRWRNIETNTTGPYELSLKENGCIIFISGLYDGSLLVCSKHSTGPRDDVNQ